MTMPEQISRERVLSTFRSINPNLSSYPDEQLLRIIGQEAPNIIRHLVDSGDKDAARFVPSNEEIVAGVRSRADDIKRLVPGGSELMSGYQPGMQRGTLPSSNRLEPPTKPSSVRLPSGASGSWDNHIGTIIHSNYAPLIPSKLPGLADYRSGKTLPVKPLPAKSAVSTYTATGDDPFSKYGGTIVEDDPFAAYGGSKVVESTKPATDTARPTPRMMPPDAGIRPPLSFMEHMKNLGRDVFTTEALPSAGTIIGGTTGGIPGAIVGGMAGKTVQNLGKAAGIGPTPPPSTSTGELQDVSMAGLKGGAEQAVAGAIHTGVSTPFVEKPYPLPRPTIHPSVRDFTDAVGKTNNIHVEDTFHDTLSKAFPSLKQAETKLGTTVNDIRDARTIAQTAAQDAWAPYKQLLDSTHRTVDRLDIIKSAGQNLPPSIPKNQARAATNIVRQWSRDLSQHEYTVNEIEDAAQALNAKLKAVYLKDGIDRAAAEKMPQYAGDEALLKAYRQLQDSTIKASTGYDAAPLRQTYGNIKAVHNALLKSPSGDDTLFDIFRRDLPTSKAEVKGKVLQKLTGSTPDQLVKKAFKNYTPPPSGTPGLVHAGWDTPSTPETGDVISSQGLQTRAVPAPKLLSERVTGPKLLPAAGDTSVKTPPPPPESFGEALKRQETPQSRRMREVVGEGPFNRQDRPATAEEYLRTKGGRKMP